MESATVSVQTRVVNETARPADVTLETTLYDHLGHQAGTTQSKLMVAAGKEMESAQTIRLPTLLCGRLLRPPCTVHFPGYAVMAKLWIRRDPVRIRSLSWSAEKGLLLNGKPVKLTGGSVHDDNGPLGAAAFDRAEERKVELLKAAGHNALRTAHNPPSPAFLDAL